VTLLLNVVVYYLLTDVTLKRDNNLSVGVL
jgi:hypothetical protein